MFSHQGKEGGGVGTCPLGSSHALHLFMLGKNKNSTSAIFSLRQCFELAGFISNTEVGLDLASSWLSPRYRALPFEEGMHRTADFHENNFNDGKAYLAEAFEKLLKIAT